MNKWFNAEKHTSSVISSCNSFQMLFDVKQLVPNKESLQKFTTSCLTFVYKNTNDKIEETSRG